MSASASASASGFAQEDEPMVNPSLLEVDNVLLQPHTGTGTRTGRWVAAFLTGRKARS